MKTTTATAKPAPFKPAAITGEKGEFIFQPAKSYATPENLVKGLDKVSKNWRNFRHTVVKSQDDKWSIIFIGSEAIEMSFSGFTVVS